MEQRKRLATNWGWVPCHIREQVHHVILELDPPEARVIGCGSARLKLMRYAVPQGCACEGVGGPKLTVGRTIFELVVCL